MAKTTSKRHYCSPEFKRDAVQLVEQGKHQAEIFMNLLAFAGLTTMLDSNNGHKKANLCHFLTN
jgi:hypothetical protein